MKIRNCEKNWNALGLGNHLDVRRRHNKPHIHAIYGDEEVVVAIDGEILEGDFPRKQMKLLEAWMTIHEEELNANWRMLSEGEGYFKIAPLN